MSATEQDQGQPAPLVDRIADHPEIATRLEESLRRAEAVVRQLQAARKVSPEMLRMVITI